MTRNVIFFLILVLCLSGCVRKTFTTLPALSAVVVDSNTGLPFDNVKINNDVTATTDGLIKFAATSEKVWVSLAPGGRIGDTRELLFKKDGYRDTLCRSWPSPLHVEETSATIPMVKMNASEAATGAPILLQLKDGWMECQAFIGSRVEYKGNVYMIGEIDQQEINETKANLFELWPVPPNDGDVVMDVFALDLLLMANQTVEIDGHFSHNESTKSLVNQAKLLLTGEKSEPQIEETELLLQQAARQGSEEAHIILGRIYTRHKTKKDYVAASFWLERAADLGSTDAMDMMALLYLDGRVIAPDNSKAAYWVRRGSDAGDLDATYNLANFYLYGTGVVEDRDEALRLLKYAARRGHQYSIDFFEEQAKNKDADAIAFLNSLPKSKKATDAGQ